MSEPFQILRAVVFDWAGTTVDYGSRAPARVFQEAFRQRGVDITLEQAREPMGMAKRDHIAAIMQMTDVASRWNSKYGAAPTDDDVQALYERFLPLQKEALSDHSDVIPGVVEVVASCRERGLRIGSSTGYTRELMEVVVPLAAAAGYAPDCVVSSDDVERGRPSPEPLQHACRQLGVDLAQMERVVKVDDTAVGIEAGINAGCWTVGITKTGNGVGLSEAEVEALEPAERQHAIADAAEMLRNAGAHVVLDAVADLMPVLEAIDRVGGKPRSLPVD